MASLGIGPYRGKPFSKLYRDDGGIVNKESITVNITQKYKTPASYNSTLNSLIDKLQIRNIPSNIISTAQSVIESGYIQQWLYEKDHGMTQIQSLSEWAINNIPNNLRDGFICNGSDCNGLGVCGTCCINGNSGNFNNNITLTWWY